MEIKKRYALKWNECNSIQFFERFFNEGLTLDVMLQRIIKMMEKLPLPMQCVIKLGLLTGLRASEVVECAKLLNVPPNFGAHYYNLERQCLEHFRFPETFLRHTKKAYVSFIAKEQLSAIGISDCKTPPP